MPLLFPIVFRNTVPAKLLKSLLSNPSQDETESLLPMSGKSVFSQYECIEIRKLLRKIRKADSERQKALRNKLRTNFLFYISDFDKSNSGFTLNDFEHLIKTGRILINLKHDPRNLPPVIELHETLLRQCIWLRSCYNSSELLFDTEDVENTALLIFADARFFEKLSEIFQEYIFILISRLTDKPKNRQNENVSIQSMNKELCEIGLMTQEIKDLCNYSPP